MIADRKVVRLYEDLISEAFHTAFRRALDSREASVVWRAISALPADEWSAAINWVLSTAAAPAVEPPTVLVERVADAIADELTNAGLIGAAIELGIDPLSLANAAIVSVGAGDSQAAADVFAERRRQVEAEGWTLEHDDEHRHGEMAVAAACYALNTADDSDGPEVRFVGAELWPWADDWWKPKDRRRDLVRAAALLLAEIERLDRVAIKGGDVG